MKLSCLGYREPGNSDCFIFTNSYTFISIDYPVRLYATFRRAHPCSSQLTHRGLWEMYSMWWMYNFLKSWPWYLQPSLGWGGAIKNSFTLSTFLVLHLFILISLHIFLTKGALYKYSVFCSCKKNVLLYVLSHGQLVKVNMVLENVHSQIRWEAF